jgi:membrane protein
MEEIKTNRFRPALKKIWYLLKETFREFNKDNAMKLSASLSYYTIFSLPPLLIIVIALCGVFFGREAVKGEIFGQINDLVGNDAALEIQEIVKNAKFSNNTRFATAVGIVILILGASGVFSEIQSSINHIWGLKAKPKRGWVKFLINRATSFSMIGCAGFLLLVSLLINSALDLLSQRLSEKFPDITLILFVTNLIVLFLIIAILFTLIFKTLPDGRIKWRDAMLGASFTGVLFMIGKFCITAYLARNSVASVYGSAGSLIVVLIWVYYSAIILYFGAEFTKVYAINHGQKIVPKEYSVEIIKEEIELDRKE